MRDRLSALLAPLGLVALVLLASALIVGPLMGQTVTIAGDSAKIAFGVTIPRVHDTTTVTIHDTVRVTLTVHDTFTVQPPVLRVDTTVATRVAGDTTYTVRQIVTLRGAVDTVRSQTFTVAVHLLAADSVRLSGWALASYDTLHYVSGNFKVFPLTMPGWVNVRWLLNGKQVATSSQVAHYSTARFARPPNGTYQLVGCARVQGQLATTPEVCSPPFALVIGVVATAPPPPPAVSLTSFALGSALAETPRVLPIWAQYTGSALRIIVQDSASGWNVDFKVPPTTMGPIDTLLAMIDHPVGTIPLPAGPLVLSACAEVQVSDSLFYHLCAPPARLP